MLSFRPAVQVLGRVLGMPVDDLELAATECWEIAPRETRFVPRAKFLPGQLDRIRGSEFGSISTVVRDFRGAFETEQPATIGFRLRNIDLVDGVLYAQGGGRHLRQRTRRSPAYWIPEEVTNGALYESWSGNRWFGNWLSEDCLAYRLAQRFGQPVTTRPADGHVLEYESLLAMRPCRLRSAHFEELLIFRDYSNNTDRQTRAIDMRERMIAGRVVREHPGVYLLRGTSGERRLLANESAIAERLESERGFRVLDPSVATLGEIIDACAGAKVVAGVEGSQLAHGMMVMPQDATLFTIFPPDRVVSVMKMPPDRQGQAFALVIGQGISANFTVDWGEVARTLDMI